MVVPSTYCFQYNEGDLSWGLVLVCSRDYNQVHVFLPVMLNAMFISYHWYIQATWKDIESATKNLETSDTHAQVSKFELGIITVLQQNFLLLDRWWYTIQCSTWVSTKQAKFSLILGNIWTAMPILVVHNINYIRYGKKYYWLMDWLQHNIMWKLYLSLILYYPFQIHVL